MENSNFKKHETFTTFEVDDRKFIINAYDPMLGNYIVFQLINFMLPFGINGMLSKEFGTEVKPSSVGTPSVMSKEDFINLQKDILVTITEQMPGGHQAPVLRENGTYGISDVTMTLVLKLLVASLAFNFKDFFKELPSLEEFMNH